MPREILIIGGVDAMAGELRAKGYDCVTVPALREAVNYAKTHSPALALLDAALAPGESAELISLLRARERFPLVAVASKAQWGQTIALLDAGVEDYVMRPFEMRELFDRIDLQLQRFASAQKETVLRYRDLILRPASFTVALCGQALSLTKQEYRILELMLSSPPGRVFTKQDFFDYAWGGGYMGVDKTINVHICNIRRKFRAITEDEYIETIWGFGFRLA